MPNAYRLTESVHGGAFTPCTVIGGQKERVSGKSLAHWMAARSYFWREQGYTILTTSEVNQVTARKPKSALVVVIRVEAAEG